MRPTCFARAVAAAALAALASLPPPARAHEPWIRPSPFRLPAPGWISFDISNSHHLFVPEENPLHDFYQVELVGPDGKASETPPTFFSGRLRIAGEAELSQPGTYLLAELSLRPIFDTRLRDGRVIDAAKDEAPPGQAVRTDVYTSSVKAFVSVKAPSPAALGPRGYPVELVPLADPTSLRAGGSLEVQMLVHGQPAAGAECLADPEGTGPEHPAQGEDEPAGTAGADGRVTLVFKRPAVWLLQCRQQIETRNDPKADYSTFRAYLVLEIGE